MVSVEKSQIIVVVPGAGAFDTSTGHSVNLAALAPFQQAHVAHLLQGTQGTATMAPKRKLDAPTAIAWPASLPAAAKPAKWRKTKQWDGPLRPPTVEAPTMKVAKWRARKTIEGENIAEPAKPKRVASSKQQASLPSADQPRADLLQLHLLNAQLLALQQLQAQQQLQQQQQPHSKAEEGVASADGAVQALKMLAMGGRTPSASTTPTCHQSDNSSSDGDITDNLSDTSGEETASGEEAMRPMDALAQLASGAAFAKRA